ncbi:MAG: LemA family protein [Alphaproteobacteria bacterium]
MPLLVLLGIAAAAIAWAISTYNGLVSLKNGTDASWRQVDVQLKRRHDLVPNLVETVRGAMDFEKGTLEAVVAARTRAVDARGPAEVSAAEGDLTRSLGRLFAVVEQYPDLKSNRNVQQLQDELTNTENLVAVARQQYNEQVRSLNTRRESFPANLIAERFGFGPREYFEGSAADREPPRVALSGSPSPRA